MSPSTVHGQAFTDYFRCPADVAAFEAAAPAHVDERYFSFGAATCYGRTALGAPVRLPGGALQLPFDPDAVARNLREERYCQAPRGLLRRVVGTEAVHRLYYGMRPLLPVAVRKHLQRIHLTGWRQLAFPRWPVDVSVDTMMQEIMRLLLERGGVREVPFIWFWPNGAQSCAIVTHDIEGQAGRGFCDALADLDESFGFRSAFQFIPESDRGASDGLIERLRARGFEVNLHDFNHDGHLFRDRKQFQERAARINAYARAYECGGFRSGAMYREQGWYDAFEFRYDMSVPNVAHLEPQRGGCCTVMPYFVGRILELPLTTVQDYSLFHILGDYSTALWKQQIETIAEHHGLITVLTHPDYLLDPRAHRVYVELLGHLRAIHRRRGIWATLPGDVDRWWRSRREMTLVRGGAGWRIEGPDSDRACLAWASLEGGRLVYTVSDARLRAAERSYA